MICPLMSYQKQYTNEIRCAGAKCAFSDDAGTCLIKQALQCYVEEKRTVAMNNDDEPWEYNWGGVD